ncbi:MAG: sialidase family protein, partial [Puniceicoccales bacterium]
MENTETNNEPLVGAYVSKSDARASFTLPTVDISDEFDRQVIIAEGTKEIYQGHPTTLLFPDGKTLLCTWTSGHGGGCGFLKRSEDGGRTWSELQDLPKSWSDTQNCPTLFRLPDPNGQHRVFVYAGSGPDGCMQMAFSEDGGKSWS